MAFDGITIACMAHELHEKLTGARISKIRQIDVAVPIHITFHICAIRMLCRRRRDRRTTANKDRIITLLFESGCRNQNFAAETIMEMK